MASISVPSVTFNIVAAPSLIENAPQRVLMIAQKNGGTAIPDALTKNIGVSGEEVGLFGAQSMLTAGIAAFRTVDTSTAIDVIALDDVAGTEAEATITFTGPATESGTLTVTIQSSFLFVFDIEVEEGDTETDVAAAVVAAINANSSILCTAVSAIGNVTLTFVHVGTVGNKVTFSITNLVDGITVDSTVFSGGSGDPDLSNIFDLIKDVRYQTVVYPGTYDLDTIKDEMNTRFNVNNLILDGVAILTDTTTFATFTDGTTYAANSESIEIFANRIIANQNAYQGGAIFEYNFTWSAIFAAVRSLRLTEGQDITDYLTGSSVTNSTGGPDRAGFPYHNTPFTTVGIVADNVDQWSNDQQPLINAAGLSFIGNNTANNLIIAGDIVTTYLKTALGAPDKTFQFLNAVDTASTIREFFFNNNKERFAQSVLTVGAVVPNVSQENTASIASFQTQLYLALSGSDFGLTVAGSAALTFFKKNLKVVITDAQAGLVTITAIIPIVSQLRQINGTLEITFDLSTT